ncbi:hypothetical protein CHLRE_07g315326v5 [Chlamydomonas reinhardtii]|uniref:Uncharacterized protein n=1 Tax=Chlamydomonas reinhardtii TaxID=3055 RepID=A0A2K3DIN3_CHLRE|nr:uncharacterized protein CHLRE_07g315326v5 [Chlamydomonas reinhardtii]PNW80385.1 hypothetical protein CHLRE_07g315326v5 [Chlamydomonas reinhardtii]
MGAQAASPDSQQPAPSDVTNAAITTNASASAPKPKVHIPAAPALTNAERAALSHYLALFSERDLIDGRQPPPPPPPPSMEQRIAKVSAELRGARSLMESNQEMLERQRSGYKHACTTGGG